MTTVYRRLRTAADHHAKKRQEERLGKEFVRKERTARKLLSEFSGIGRKRRNAFKKLIDLGNSVAAAFETAG